MTAEQGATPSEPRSINAARLVLERERELENAYEALTRSMLEAESLGRTASEVNEHVGAALFLLSQIATCQWGCRNVEHVIEALIRRLCNHAFAALRLTFFGHYDEALGLVRGIAEIANLLQLFSVDADALQRWRASTPAERRRQFSPVKVRRAIEASGRTPATDEDTYGDLCEIGVHVSPDSLFLSHELEGRIYVGGRFSVPGFLLAINQLGLTLAPSLTLAGHLVDAPPERIIQLDAAERQLRNSTSWLNVTNYADLFSEVRKQEILKLLKDVTEEQRLEALQGAILELLGSGEVSQPDQFDDIEAEKVYELARQKLVREVLSASHQRTMRWIEESAQIAAAHHALREAGKYR